MRTIETDIAKTMEELTPPGTQFVVVIFYDAYWTDVYGPFDSWKEAAEWANDQKRPGVVYPLRSPT